jgi:hypothetical protein
VNSNSLKIASPSQVEAAQMRIALNNHVVRFTTCDCCGKYDLCYVDGANVCTLCAVKHELASFGLRLETKADRRNAVAAEVIAKLNAESAAFGI